MNQERSPDDHELILPSQLARVEQQLKRRIPRPVALDAEAILRAASNVSVVAGIADQGHRGRASRRGLWTALGASWLGGAIAGSIVTALLLSRPTVPEIGPHVVQRKIQAPGTDVAAGEDDAWDGARKQSPREDIRDEVPAWSASELLASTRILRLDRAFVNSFGGQPLQVGSYVRLTATADSWPAFGSTDARPVERTGSTSLDRGSSAAEAEPAPSITREQLLQELLGRSPASML